MGEIVAIAVIICIICGAGIYILRAKKKGKVKCIGCPYAKDCNSVCSKCEREVTDKAFTKDEK